MSVICAAQPLSPNASFKSGTVEQRAQAVSNVLALQRRPDGTYAAIPYRALVEKLSADYTEVEDASVDEAVQFLATENPPFVDDSVHPMTRTRMVKLNREFTLIQQEGPRTAEWVEDIDREWAGPDLERQRALVHTAHVLDFAVTRALRDRHQMVTAAGKRQTRQHVWDRPREVFRYVRDTLTAWENGGRLASLPEDFVASIQREGEPTDDAMESFLAWMVANNAAMGEAVFGSQTLIFPGLTKVATPGSAEREAWTKFQLMGPAAASHIQGTYRDLLQKVFMRGDFTHIDSKGLHEVDWHAFDNFAPNQVTEQVLVRIKKRMRELDEGDREKHELYPTLTEIAKEEKFAGGLLSGAQLTMMVRHMAKDSGGRVIYRDGRVSYIPDIERMSTIVGKAETGKAVPIGIAPNSISQIDELDRSMPSVEPQGTISTADDLGLLPYLGGPFRMMLNTPFDWMSTRVRMPMGGKGFVPSDSENAEIARVHELLHKKGIIDDSVSPAQLVRAYTKLMPLLTLTKDQLDAGKFNYRKNPHKRFFLASDAAKRFLPPGLNFERTKRTRNLVALVGYLLTPEKDMPGADSGSKNKRKDRATLLNLIELLSTGATDDRELITQFQDTLPKGALEFKAVQKNADGTYRDKGGVFNLVEQTLTLKQGNFVFVDADGEVALDSDAKPRTLDKEKDYTLVAYYSPLFNVIGWLRENSADFDREYQRVHHLLMQPMVQGYFAAQQRLVEDVFKNVQPWSSKVATSHAKKYQALAVADNLMAVLTGGDLLTMLNSGGTTANEVIEAFDLEPGADVSGMKNIRDLVIEREGKKSEAFAFEMSKIMAMKLRDIPAEHRSHPILRLPNGVRDTHAFFQLTPVSFAFVHDRHLQSMEMTVLGRMPHVRSGAAKREPGSLMTHMERVSEVLIGGTRPWVGDYEALSAYQTRMKNVEITARSGGDPVAMSAMEWNTLQGGMYGLLVNLPRLTSNPDAYLRLLSREVKTFRTDKKSKMPGTLAYFSPQEKEIVLREDIGADAVFHETIHGGPDAGLKGLIKKWEAEARRGRGGAAVGIRGKIGDLATHTEVYDRFFKEKHGKPLDNADLLQLMSALYRFSYIGRWYPDPGANWGEVLSSLQIGQNAVRQVATEIFDKMGRSDRAAYRDAAEQAIRELMASATAPRSVTDLVHRTLAMDSRSFITMMKPGGRLVREMPEDIRNHAWDKVRDWLNDLLTERHGFSTRIYWTNGPEMLARMGEVVVAEMATRDGQATGKLRTSTFGLTDREKFAVTSGAYIRDEQHLDRVYRLFAQFLRNIRTVPGVESRLEAAPMDLSNLSFNNTPDAMIENEAERVANEIMDAKQSKEKRYDVIEGLVVPPDVRATPAPDPLTGVMRSVEEGETALLVVWDIPVATVPVGLARKVMQAVRRHETGASVRALGKALEQREVQGDPDALAHLRNQVRRFVADHGNFRSVTEIDEYIASAPAYGKPAPHGTLAVSEEAAEHLAGESVPFVSYVSMPGDMTTIDGFSPQDHPTEIAMPQTAVQPIGQNVTPIVKQFLGDDEHRGLNLRSDEIDAIAEGWAKAEGTRMAGILEGEELEKLGEEPGLAKMEQQVSFLDEEIAKANRRLATQRKRVRDKQDELDRERARPESTDADTRVAREAAIKVIERELAKRQEAAKATASKIDADVALQSDLAEKAREARKRAVKKAAPKLEGKAAKMGKERLEKLINFDEKEIYGVFYPKGHESWEAPSRLQMDALTKALSQMGLNPDGGNAKTYRVSDLVQMPALFKEQKGKAEYDYNAGFLSALGTGAGKTRIIATLHRVRTMVALKGISRFLATAEDAQTDSSGNRVLRYQDLTQEQHSHLFDTSPEYRALVTSATMIDVTGNAQGVIRGFSDAMVDAGMMTEDDYTIDEDNNIVEAEDGYLEIEGETPFRLINYSQVDFKADIRGADRDPVSGRIIRPDHMYPRPGDAIFVSSYEQITRQDEANQDRLAHFLYDTRYARMSKLSEKEREHDAEIQYMAGDPPLNFLKFLYLTGVDSVVDTGPGVYTGRTYPADHPTRARQPIQPHADFARHWVVNPAIKSSAAFKDIRTQLSYDEADTVANLSTLGLTAESDVGEAGVGGLAGQSRGVRTRTVRRDPSKRAMLLREISRLYFRAPVLYSTATPFKDAGRLPFLERVLGMFNPDNPDVTPTRISRAVRGDPTLRSSLVTRLSQLGIASFAMLPIYPDMIEMENVHMADDNDLLLHTMAPWRSNPQVRLYGQLLKDHNFQPVNAKELTGYYDLDEGRLFRNHGSDPNIPENSLPMRGRVRKAMNKKVTEGKGNFLQRMTGDVEALYHQRAILPKVMDYVVDSAARNFAPIIGVTAIGDAFARRQAVIAAINGEDDLAPRMTLENFVRYNILRASPVWRLAPQSVKWGSKGTAQAVVKEGGRTENIQQRKLIVPVVRDTLYTWSWVNFLRNLRDTAPHRIPDAALLEGLFGDPNAQKDEDKAGVSDAQGDKPVLIMLEEVKENGVKRTVPFIGVRKKKGGGIVGKARLTPMVMALVAESKGVQVDQLDFHSEGNLSSFQVLHTGMRDQVLRDVNAHLGNRDNLLPIIEMSTSDREITLADGTKTTFKDRFLQLTSMGFHFEWEPYEVTLDNGQKVERRRLKAKPRDHKTEREGTIQSFNSDDWHFLVAGTQSAARGINLHKTREEQPDRLTMPLDTGDDPNTMIQLLGRQHRSGRVGRIKWVYINSNFGSFNSSQWPMFSKLSESSELTTGSKEMLVGQLPPFIDINDDEVRQSVRSAIRRTVDDWFAHPGNYGGISPAVGFEMMSLIEDATAQGVDDKVRDYADSSALGKQKNLLVNRLPVMPLQFQQQFVRSVLRFFATAETDRIARLPLDEIPGPVDEIGHVFACDDGSGLRHRFKILQYYRGHQNIFRKDFAELLAPAKAGEDESQQEARRMYVSKADGENWVIDRNRPTLMMTMTRPDGTTSSVPHVLVHKFTNLGWYGLRDKWVPEHRVEEMERQLPSVGSMAMGWVRHDRQTMEAEWERGRNWVEQNAVRDRTFVYTGDPLTFFPLFDTDFRKVRYTAAGETKTGYAISFGVGDGATLLTERLRPGSSAFIEKDSDYRKEFVDPRRQAFSRVVDTKTLADLDRAMLDRNSVNTYDRVKEALTGISKGNYMLWIEDIGVMVRANLSTSGAGAQFIMRGSMHPDYQEVHKQKWAVRPEVREWRILISSMVNEVGVSPEGQLAMFHLLFPHARLYMDGSPEYQRAYTRVTAQPGPPPRSTTTGGTTPGGGLPPPPPNPTSPPSVRAPRLPWAFAAAVVDTTKGMVARLKKEAKEFAKRVKKEGIGLPEDVRREAEQIGEDAKVFARLTGETIEAEATAKAAAQLHEIQGGDDIIVTLDGMRLPRRMRNLTVRVMAEALGMKVANNARGVETVMPSRITGEEQFVRHYEDPADEVRFVRAHERKHGRAATVRKVMAIERALKDKDARIPT